jgi:glycosidase
MQWTAGPQAGFSTTSPWIAIDPGYSATNVEAETSDPTSLLSHYRLLLGLRNQHPALRSSVMDLVTPSQPGVFASLRVSEDEAILVIVNLAGAQVSDYRLSVSSSHLLAGRYSTESLTGSASFDELVIGKNGAFAESWIGPDLGAYGTLVLRLVPH